RPAASGLVIKPAMVIAAQTAFFDIAIAQIGAAMFAMPVEEAVGAAEILVEDEILAHEPHRLCAGSLELAGAGNRPPIAPQQFAHRRPRPGRGQETPAVLRLKLRVVRHDDFRYRPTNRVPPGLYNHRSGKSMAACRWPPRPRRQ